MSVLREGVVVQGRRACEAEMAASHFLQVQVKSQVISLQVQVKSQVISLQVQVTKIVTRVRLESKSHDSSQHLCCEGSQSVR